MKNISLITLNMPGIKAAEMTALDLLKINPDFVINIFYKGDDYVPQDGLKACYLNYYDLDEVLLPLWRKSDAIIWFTSTGVAVRKIAKFLASKRTDPAVLVMNLDRTQIIPLVSGHIGGANELAKKLTQVNKQLVSFVTTATDSLGLLSLDTYTMDSGFEIINITKLAVFSNALINEDPVNVITFPKIKEDLKNKGLNGSNTNFYDYYDDMEKINMSYPTTILSPFIEDEAINKFENALNIRIRPIALGIGVNRGIPYDELYSDFIEFVKEHKLDLNDIKVLASYEAKRDEGALNMLALKMKIPLIFFGQEEINNIDEEFSDSQAQKFFNIKGVAEPTAILASQYKTLFIRKNVYKNATIAAAF